MPACITHVRFIAQCNLKVSFHVRSMAYFGICSINESTIISVLIFPLLKNNFHNLGCSNTGGMSPAYLITSAGIYPITIYTWAHFSIPRVR